MLVRSLISFLLLVQFPLFGSGAQPRIGQQSPFTENKGQVGDQNHRPRPDVLFYGKSGNLTFHLRKTGVSYQLSRVDEWTYMKHPMKGGAAMGQFRPSVMPGGSGMYCTSDSIRVPGKISVYRVDIEWLGANGSALVERRGESEDYENFYNATAPDGVTFVRSYESVRYKRLYPGVDLRWHRSTNGVIKYDFEVSAGGDASRIALRIDGADRLNVNERGELEIHTPLGTIVEGLPVVEQHGGKPVGKWEAIGNVVRYSIDGVDRTKPFVIDPAVRTWGTYYGGAFTQGSGCVAHPDGNVVLFGYTMESPLVATFGAHQTQTQPGFDAFAALFDRDGARAWGTYYGGAGEDLALCGAAGPDGGVFLAGYTGGSPAGIATPGAHEVDLPDNLNYWGWLARLDGAGLRSWGSYYSAKVFSCAADSSGNLLISGFTEEDLTPPFIATPGAHQTTYGGNVDAFVAKFTADGVRLWGTYFGGSESEPWSVVCCSPSGDVYLAGGTGSSNGIATPGAHEEAFPGPFGPGFIAKFNSNGERLWGTYYGGGHAIEIFGCAARANGDVAVVGRLTPWCPGCPVTPGVLATPGAHLEQVPIDAFDLGIVATFHADGTRDWATMYAGEGSVMLFLSCTFSGQDELVVSGNYCTTAVDSITAALRSEVLTTDCAHQRTILNPFDFFGCASSTWVGSFSSDGRRTWGTLFGGRGEVPNLNSSYGGQGRVYASGWVAERFGYDALGMSSDNEEVATPNGHQPVFFGDPDTLPNDVVNAYLVQFQIPSYSLCGNTLSQIYPADSYQWLDCGTGQSIQGENGPQLTFTQPGSYAVVIQHNGCVDTLACQTVALAPVLIVGPDVAIGAGSSTTLTVSGGGAGAQYAWDPPDGLSCTDCAAPVASPSATTTYCAQVAGDACSDSACVTVFVTEGSSVCEVFVPNAFSPNGSGKNDLHCVYGNCVASLTLSIFDRWGTKVFESTDRSKCWDGTFKGEPLDAAVFVYDLTATLVGGDTVQRKGNITLIR